MLGLTAWLALLVLITGGGVAYVNSRTGQRQLVRLINSRIPGSVALDSLHLRPAAGKLLLTGVELRDPEGGLALSVGRVFLDLDWRPLFQRRISIRQLDLDKPRLDLHEDEHKGPNLLRVFRDAPAAPPGAGGAESWTWDVQIGRLHLARGELLLAQGPSWPGAHLEGIDLALAGHLAEKTGTLSLHFSRGRVSHADRHLALGSFAFDLPVTSAAAAPLDLKLELPGGLLTLNGRINHPFSRPDIDLAASLALNPATAGEQGLAAVFLPDLPLSGQLKAALKARGAINDPLLELDASWAGGNLRNISWEDLQARMAFHKGRLTIKSLALAAWGGAARMQGQVDLAGLGQAAVLVPSYDLSLTLDAIQAARLPAAQPLPAGLLAGEFTLSGEGVTLNSLAAALAGEGSYQMASTDPGGTGRLFELYLDSQLKGSGIRIAELRLAGLDSRLTCTGEADWRDKTLSARYDLHAAGLQTVGALAGLAGLKGALNISGSIQGPWARPALAMNLNGRGLGKDPFDLGDLTAELRLDSQGQLNVAALDLKNQESRIRGQGQWTLPISGTRSWDAAPLNVDVNIENLKPAHFFRDSPASGVFTGRITLAGSLKAPQGEIELHGKDLAARGYRIGDLAARINLSGPILSFEKFSVANQSSRLEVKGSAGLPFLMGQGSAEGREPLDLTVSAKPFFLEDFLPDLKGAVVMEAQLTGTPQAPQAKASLNVEDLALYGQRVAGVAARVELSGKRVDIPDLIFTLAEGETLAGQGRYDFDRGYAFKLAGSGLHLRHIQAWRQQDLPDGRLSLKLSGQGTLDNPRVNGDLFLEHMAWGEVNVPEIRLELELARRKASLKGDLGFPLLATYDFGSGELTAQSHWKDTDLAPYLRLAGQPELGGRLSGNLELTGDPRVRESLNVALDLAALSLTRKGHPLMATRNLKGSLSRGVWQVLPAELVLPGPAGTDARLTFAGQGSLTGAVKGSLKGTIPAGMAGIWLEPDWAPQGQVNLDLVLGGKLSAPRVTGSLALNEMGITIPDWGQTLHQLNGRIELASQAVSFNQVAGRLDEGHFTLTGQVALDQWRPAKVNLRFNADALPLDIPETLMLVANGDLRLAGDPHELWLTGKLDLVESHYIKEMVIRPLPAEGLAEDGAADADPAPRDKTREVPEETWWDPWRRALKFNVELNQREPFLVENNLANMDIAFDLNLIGSLHDPAISGRAEVLSGEVTYPLYSGLRLPAASLLPVRTVTFEVIRGVLDFINPYAIEPELDITGKSVVRDWEIYLKLKGVPDELVFGLSSEPWESEADIIALLLTGKTTRELSKGGGGDSLLSPEQLALSVFGGSMADNLKTASGLDILEAQSGTGADGESRNMSVTVGKNLSDRMAVKYSVGSEDGERLERTTAEYRLRRNVLVSGYRDNLGKYGGALRWRLEFR